MKFFKGNELIFRFMLINISSGIAVGMMNFIIPVYALSLNATSSEIGMIKGFSGLGDVLFVLPAGLIVDYLGSRKTYSVSCIFSAAIIMLLSLAATSKLILLTMLFYGVSKTFRMTALSADFFNNMNTIGIKKAGWYKASMTIGASLIGPIIGGLAVIAFSFKSYFLLTGAILLIPFMVINARSKNEIRSVVITHKSSLVDCSNHYKSLTKNKILVSATIKNGLNTAFFMTFTVFITVMVIKVLGLSPGIAAALISIKGVSTLLVGFFAGGYVQKNNSKLYLFAYITTIISLLLLGFGTDTIQLGLASFINGVGTGLITLINFTEVGSIDGEKGKIAGFFSFGNGTGAIIGPMLGGIIADVYGVQAIFLAFIVPFSALAIHDFISVKRIAYENVSKLPENVEEKTAG
jgi:MFS family permease